MDKLYACTQQRRTLLITLVMLLLAPLSMLTFGQSPCSSPVTRIATNGKSTNSNIYDDITLAMTNLLGEGTEAAWVMESGGTFTENPDGTAHFQGVVKQFGDYASPRRLSLDITLGGKSYAPDASGPYNQTGVPTSGWYYYYSLSGTMTGLDALAGGQLSLAIHMHPFQVGIGANQLFNAEDQVSNGAGGWFEWTIDSQPTDNALQFTNYIPGFTISDIAILLSGTPSVPCTDPCDGIVSVRKVLNTATNCGTGTSYAMYFAGNYYTAGSDLTFTEYTNGTAVLKGTVIRNGQSFPVNVTYSGKTTTAPVSSPKFELCATAANTNNANGWMYYTDMTGTIETETGVCQVLRRGPSFQTGLFGNLQEKKLGASGWFSCSNNTNVGDFNFNIGEILACAPVDLCLNDTEAPIFTNKPINITLTADCRTNQAIATWATPTATDNCSTPIVIGTRNSGSSFGVGTTVVTYTATDAKGNATSCTFLVIVNAANDTQAPTFSNCPSNIAKDVTGMLGTCWTINWIAPTATDNCSTPSVTSNYNSGQCFPIGVTTVIYTATDAKGNKATCSFTITIKRSISCSVSGNTISKSCSNNIPVVTGSTLSNYEYVWLKSTTGCPTQSSQMIAGATGQNYSLSSSVTQTTYFVRCARPVGCTTWGPINESNCVSITPTDCKPTCSVNFSSTKSYRIISKKSGKVLDVSGSGTRNDCPIIQWSYNGGANQQWRFFSLGSGYFKVMARNSSKYIACHYTSNSSKVYQYDYYSGGYKDWKVECVGNSGYYRLVHRASGKVLDISGGSTADGAATQIYTWTGSDNQLFSIEEVTAAPVYLTSSSATVLALNVTAQSDRVRLGWLSNTGYDNDFYTVEKMNASTGDFEKLSLVNNTQYDDQVQTHVAEDLYPTEGDNFYRVKVTLNDGFEKFTEVKKVSFKRMIGFGAFPNPATDELNVNLSEYTGKAVDMVIYNSFGKVITRQHVDNVTNTIHTFDINDFAAGQYLIRVSAEGKRDATQQVVIQK